MIGNVWSQPARQNCRRWFSFDLKCRCWFHGCYWDLIIYTILLKYNSFEPYVGLLPVALFPISCSCIEASVLGRSFQPSFQLMFASNRQAQAVHIENHIWHFLSGFFDVSSPMRWYIKHTDATVIFCCLFGLPAPKPFYIYRNVYVLHLQVMKYNSTQSVFGFLKNTSSEDLSSVQQITHSEPR